MGVLGEATRQATRSRVGSQPKRHMSHQWRPVKSVKMQGLHHMDHRPPTTKPHVPPRRPRHETRTNLMFYTPKQTARLRSLRIKRDHGSTPLTVNELAEVERWEQYDKAKRKSQQACKFTNIAVEPKPVKPCETFGGRYGLDTPEMRHEVRELRKSGEPPETIAERLGISIEYVVKLGSTTSYPRVH